MKEIDFKRVLSGKKVIITGGLGFIGSNLAIKLVTLGAKVNIVDALIPAYGGNLFNIEPVKDLVKWVKGDIRDKKLVDGLVEDKEIIFNLAGTCFLKSKAFVPSSQE